MSSDSDDCTRDQSGRRRRLKDRKSESSDTSSEDCSSDISDNDLLRNQSQYTTDTVPDTPISLILDSSSSVVESSMTTETTESSLLDTTGDTPRSTTSGCDSDVDTDNLSASCSVEEITERSFQSSDDCSGTQCNGNSDWVILHKNDVPLDESESELESGPSFRRDDDMVGMSDENSNDQSDDATHCVRYTRDSSSYHQDVDDITTGVKELNIDESRCKSRTDSSDQSECSTSSDDSQLSEEQCVTDSEQHTDMSDLSDLDEELVDTSGDNIDNLLTDNMETQPYSEAQVVDNDHGSETSLDLSAVQSTAPLRLDACRFRADIGKRGSMANRRKPTKQTLHDVRNSDDLYSDATDYKQHSEKHIEEKELNQSESSSESEAESTDDESLSAESPIPKAIEIKEPGVKTKKQAGGIALLPKNISEDLNKRMNMNNDQPQSMLKPVTKSVSEKNVEAPSEQNARVRLRRSPAEKPPVENGDSVEPANPTIVYNRMNLRATPERNGKPNDHDITEKKPHSPAWVGNINLRRTRTEESSTFILPRNETPSSKPSWMDDVMKRKQNTNKVLHAEAIRAESPPSCRVQPVWANKRGNLRKVERPGLTLEEPKLSKVEIKKTDNVKTEVKSQQDIKEQSNSKPSRKDSTSSSSSEEETTDKFEITKGRQRTKEADENTPPTRSGDSAIKKTINTSNVVMRHPKRNVPENNNTQSSNGDSNIPAWKQALNIRRQQNGNRSSLFLLNDKQTDNDGNESIPAWKRELKEKKKRRESMELQSTPVISSEDSSPAVPMWKQNIMLKKTQIATKEVKREQSSDQPEWMRKVQERRDRLKGQ